jgi:Membrane bound beta barrel domain (DUF5777)
MKNILLLLLFTPFFVIAQDEDLLGVLDKAAPTKPQTISATFKGTRIINGHSVETVKKKHLDFLIMHRFGTLNSGYKNVFGLDESRVRISFEFGITDNLTVGVGRSSYLKEYDYYAKYRLLRQKTDNSMPVSVTLFATASTNTTDTSPSMQFFNNTQRQSYVSQLLIARKFSDNLSLQLMPTILHRNKTETTLDPNTLYALGMGGRIKLNKRLSFNAEYFYVPKTIAGKSRDSQYTNNLSIGFDIETGGHVFQLHLTNSRGMIDKQFIGGTTGQWKKGDIFYGFNISRMFSLDKKSKRMLKSKQ